MKGISGNSAVDAFRRTASTQTRPATQSGGTAKPGSLDRKSVAAAQVEISSRARELASQAAGQDSGVEESTEAGKTGALQSTQSVSATTATRQGSDASKVEALKAQVEVDTFQVNATAVAEGLLFDAG